MWQKGLSSTSHTWRRTWPLPEPCRINLPATLSFYRPVSYLYLPLVKCNDSRGEDVRCRNAEMGFLSKEQCGDEQKMGSQEGWEQVEVKQLSS